jgi:hypothetical protein
MELLTIQYQDLLHVCRTRSQSLRSTLFLSGSRASYSRHWQHPNRALVSGKFSEKHDTAFPSQAGNHGCRLTQTSMNLPPLPPESASLSASASQMRRYRSALAACGLGLPSSFLVQYFSLNPSGVTEKFFASNLQTTSPRLPEQPSSSTSFNSVRRKSPGPAESQRCNDAPQRTSGLRTQVSLAVDFFASGRADQQIYPALRHWLAVSVCVGKRRRLGHA